MIGIVSGKWRVQSAYASVVASQKIEPRQKPGGASYYKNKQLNTNCDKLVLSYADDAQRPHHGIPSVGITVCKRFFRVVISFSNSSNFFQFRFKESSLQESDLLLISAVELS